MIIERKVIRNYFELNGSFEGIEEELPTLVNKMTREEMYNCIGIKASEKFSAEELFNMRSRYYQGETELEEVLCENDMIVYPSFKNQEFKYLEYTKILYSYLKVTRNNIIGDTDVRKLLYDLSNEKIDHIVAMLATDEFKGLMLDLMPKFKYKEGCKPAVMLNTFYHDKKLNKKDINLIRSQAIKALMFNSLDIAEEYRVVIKTLLKDNLTDLADYNIEAYRKIIDISLFLGIPARVMLTKCGMKLVDYVEQYKKYRAVFRVYFKGIRIVVNDAEMGVSKAQFKALYEGDFLGYLSTNDKNEIIVTKGNNRTLASMLGVRS
ncbi:hypothetical protein UT300012_23260 [Paraclostridium bifermentans]